MAKAKRNWRLRIVVLAYLGPFLVILFFTGIHSYIKKEIRELLSEDEYREMLRFFEEPATFPDEWAVVTPYSQEFRNEIEKSRAVFEEWKGRETELTVPRRILSGTQTVYYRGRTWDEPRSESLLDILSRGGEITSEELRLAEDAIEATSPLLQVFLGFSAIADYELSAVPDLTPVHRGARLLALNSHLLAGEGDWAGAIETSLVALRLARRHPASTIITHLIGIACEIDVLGSVARLLVDCGDPEAMRPLSAELHRLDSSLHFNNLHLTKLLDPLGALRIQKRQAGSDVDLTPGQPRAFYWRQGWIGRSNEAPNLTWTDDILVIMAVRSFGYGNALARALWIDRLLYAANNPNFLEARIREMVCRAEFDLVRLLVANRIRELESGSRTSEPTDLVPEWMPEVPVDSFTLDPFLWDATDEIFYSVGPDRIDSGNSVRYDPTNGTKTLGDISLP